MGKRLVSSRGMGNGFNKITKLMKRQKSQKNHLVGYLTVLALALKEIEIWWWNVCGSRGGINPNLQSCSGFWAGSKKRSGETLEDEATAVFLSRD